MLAIFLQLFLASGSVGLKEANLGDRNQTVECTFDQSILCFNKIASLGGNFSSVYAEKGADLNRTCSENVSPQTSFLNCLNSVPSMCKREGQQPLIGSIEAFVRKLCKNNSEEQNNFLNSSVCYNSKIARRQNCVKQQATTKIDARSKCCQSKKIQECLKKDMLRVCSQNDTDFQNMLVDTYSSYTNALCVDYNQRCGAVIHTLSLACIIFALKAIFVSSVLEV